MHELLIHITSQLHTAVSAINSSPEWLRLLVYGTYSLFFGSFLGSVLNRQTNPLTQAQDEREYILLNYGTDIAPELKDDPYKGQKRSVCPNCRNQLKFYHNIPVLSYILLLGRCGFCGCEISKSYPIIESSVMLLMLAFGYSVDFQLDMFCMVFLVFSMSAVSIMFTDFKTMKVYDRDSVIYCLSAVAIFHHFYFINLDMVLSSVYTTIGLVCLSEALGFVLRRDSGVIGEGDYPLIAVYILATAIFIAPYSLVAVTSYTAALLLLNPIIVASYALVFRKRMPKEIPFAPLIISGTIGLIITHGQILLPF